MPLMALALRIMNFQPKNSHTSPLFRKTSLLFISKSIKNLLPSLFNNWFVFSSDGHKYNNSWSSDDKLQTCSYRTNTYDKNLFIISAIELWNTSQILFKTSYTQQN